MNKTAQKRLFSLAMIFAVLATSILASAFTPPSTDDCQEASSDQQIPFEETEKEFEDDKDEADEKTGSLALFCEVAFYDHKAVSQYQFVSLDTQKPYHDVPLFLSHHRFLI